MKTGSRLSWQWCVLLSSVMCAFVTGAAFAQSYPSKTIRIIVPFPPGGGTDLIARLLGQNLTAVFGQQVLIDNRPGAAGNIGTELAAKAPPDGYALFFVGPTLVTNPSLYRKVSYDPIKDFAPITQITGGAYMLVVHPSVPAKTVKELIAVAKSKKGGITYASGGSGVPGHLGMELLKTLGRFDALHVPYKGTGPAMIDVMAGQVDAFISPIPSGQPHMKSGRIKALAVTSLKRSVLLPDVPTVAEGGFPGYEVSNWYGMLAPAGTSRDVVTRLYQELSRILKLPDVRDRMVADGADPLGTTPEEFAAYIQAELIKWKEVIKQSGTRAD